MVIATKDNTEPLDAAPERPDAFVAGTAAFFHPGGGLELAHAGSAFGYEFRPQQQRMAETVARAIHEHRHLCVEAGTGVGKSFAYLVPAILAAKEMNTRVVVSTYTISLQEQLIHKDIPFLQKHLGLDFRAVLVKGRSNYLCLRRLAVARRKGGDLFLKHHQRELDAIHEWSLITDEGSQQDLPQEPSHDVWSMVCAEQGICVASPRGDHSMCFFNRARKQMATADVLVVNHHLLFSELALKLGGASFLPPYGIVIIDEAHQMEDVATEHMGLRLSQYGFSHWLKRLYDPDKNRGLLQALKLSGPAHHVNRLHDATKLFFHEVNGWAGFKSGESQRVVTEPLPLTEQVSGTILDLCNELKPLVEDIEDADLQAELRSCVSKGQELQKMLKAFMEQSLEDQIYWVELEGRNRKPILHSAPVEVAPLIKKSLFDGDTAVVMTSATLSVNNSMAYFQKRVGAENADAELVGSPFDYNRQMRIQLPGSMPDPSEESAFIAACAPVVTASSIRNQGRTFVLCTSISFMTRLLELVRRDLEEAGLSLLVQGEGMPRHQMLANFKVNPGSVLFGLDSFWMGVDVPGEALSNVIITRLPFSVPDRPVIKARMDRIKERGGDPFKEYSLPEAILKFRQGVGRLIRTTSDEGTVLILDPRIRTKWYGKVFLASIPECPVEIIPGGPRMDANERE